MWSESDLFEPTCHPWKYIWMVKIGLAVLEISQAKKYWLYMCWALLTTWKGARLKTRKAVQLKGSRMMSPNLTYLMWSWPLTFCIWVIVTQWAFTLMCACRVWLKMQDSSWGLSKRDFCDLLLVWPRDPKKWPFRAVAPPTTCVSVHHISSFVVKISCSQFGNRWTDQSSSQ